MLVLQLFCLFASALRCCSEAQPSASARTYHNLAISSSTTIVIKQSALKLLRGGDKIWAKKDLDALALTTLRGVARGTYAGILLAPWVPRLPWLPT